MGTFYTELRPSRSLSGFFDPIDTSPFFLMDFNSLSLESDETELDTGLFQNSSSDISFSNNTSEFSLSSGNSFFPSGRDGSIIDIFYSLDNKQENKVRVFRGILDEKNSKEDIIKKQVSFSLLSMFELLKRKTIIRSELENFIIQNPDLNKSFLLNYLEFLNENRALSNAFDYSINNIFLSYEIKGIIMSRNDERLDGDTGLAFETKNVSSDFNQNGLEFFALLLKALNCVAYFDYTGDKPKLFIKNKSVLKKQDVSIFSNVLNTNNYPIYLDLMDIQTDSKKIFNQINFDSEQNQNVINIFKGKLVDSSSIISYGVSKLDLSDLFFVPYLERQQVASEFLKFYSHNKKTISLKIKMTNETIKLKILDLVQIQNYNPVESFDSNGHYNRHAYGLAKKYARIIKYDKILNESLFYIIEIEYDFDNENIILKGNLWL